VVKAGCRPAAAGRKRRPAGVHRSMSLFVRPGGRQYSSGASRRKSHRSRHLRGSLQLAHSHGWCRHQHVVCAPSSFAHFDSSRLSSQFEPVYRVNPGNRRFGVAVAGSRVEFAPSVGVRGLGDAKTPKELPGRSGCCSLLACLAQARIGGERSEGGLPILKPSATAAGP